MRFYANRAHSESNLPASVVVAGHQLPDCSANLLKNFETLEAVGWNQ